MNIYLGPKCNFEKHAFFLNSNKIVINSKIKILFDFIIKSSIFLYFGKSFYSLSHIFIIEIIEDKINKIEWSYFENLRKLKYENNEIPNSLRGSLSCVEFLGSNQNAINMICNDDPMYNIPNWKFGMLQTYPLKMNLALEIRVG